ncbi:DUF2406 domain-containing protein [Kluyveromyces lactis]|uniref:KLLA0A09933p n=1 Tax=Kluyveromyces lactis (strain ATCC 8585 / CBS 2359 / DSM 70799 / NBRC 1267 / NRRL Y-1140 / WM37) TaxID=284590 RepID=Q6CXA5_KLULA|nr:uncharacterized protein KLLA0_A09933g [Kluyveromyces lactis]CAH03022.1 KLLA0A09933p [Kluyveromyces lactis]|eukprot:XP_451434.1 uncharacterized protein KLLA0_A09933g [Kluyveromyces lactis]
MGVFNRRSSGDSSSHGSTGSNEVKITKEDRQHLKVRTASVHDPILEAVQEMQPFEQAADTFQGNMNRQSHVPTGELKDVFGQPIQQPDVSNPTRSRDERPLDTIRGFEYSISGDPTWSQQLETPQYGFRVRPGFQAYTGGVAGNGNDHHGYPSNLNMNTNTTNSYQQQGVYQAPVSDANKEQKTKKKRGFFGRKKKD